MAETNDILEGSLTKSLGTVRQKNFDGKCWYSPPFLSMNLIATGNIPKHSTKEFHCKGSGCCDTKQKSTKNRDITVLSMNIFRTRNQWHRKGFPYETFPHSGQKIFEGNSWHSPLLIPKIFGYRKLFETQHRRVPLRKASVPIDTKFSTESLTLPPPASHLNFFDPRNWWKTKGFAYAIFRHCGAKFVWRES